MLELVPESPAGERDRSPYAASAPMKPTVPSALCDLLTRHGRADRFIRLQQMRSYNDDAPSAFLITEGWAASAIAKNNGELCMISLYFPGDIVGLPQIITPRCAELNFAVSPLTAIRLNGKNIEAIFEDIEYNRILAAMMHRERERLVNRLVAAAQGDSASKLAQFLVELISRSAVKPVDNRIRLQTPLRQSDIADFVSMTNVHVNRTLRGPRMRHMVEMRAGLIKN